MRTLLCPQHEADQIESARNNIKPSKHKSVVKLEFQFQGGMLLPIDGSLTYQLPIFRTDPRCQASAKAVEQLFARFGFLQYFQRINITGAKGSLLHVPAVGIAFGSAEGRLYR